MKRPNIVLFLAEDLDFECVNCFNQYATSYSGLNEAGNPYAREHFAPNRGLLTPHIDCLAGDGVLFDNYYCASPVCTPARYTVMTGRFPERSREFCELNEGKPATVWFNTPVTPGETLLPRVLHEDGYRTGMFGKWHNFPREIGREIHAKYHSFPQDIPWEDERAQKGVREGYQTAVNYLKKPEFGWDVVDRLYHDNPEPYLPECLSSQNIDWVVEGAVNYIQDQKEREDPFFAYVAVSLPHSRYNGKRFLEANPLSSPAGLLEEPPHVMADRQTIYRRVKAAGLPDSACEGLWLDEAIRALRRAIRFAGKEEDTCFIFTTDHPTAGKGSVHLGRIPLIIYWPGHIEGGLVQSALLSETDLASTILEIAGAKIPDEMQQDGHSFLGLLTSGEYQERSSILMELVNSRAVVKDGFKYIANRLPNGTPEEIAALKKVGWLAQPVWHEVYWNLLDSFPNYFDEDELYDIAADPLEQHNLAKDPAYREVLVQMRAQLAEHLRTLPHPFGEFTQEK